MRWYRLRAALQRRWDDLGYTWVRRRRRVLGVVALASLVALALCLRVAIERLSDGVVGAVGPSSTRIFGIDFGIDYGNWHRARRLPLLVDATGRGAGMLPPALIPGAPSQPIYRTSDPGPLPDRWWDLVVAIEDRNRGRWFHVYGVDLKGLLRAILTAGRSGGSTLEMQLAKTIKADTGRRGFGRVVRKVRDVLHAPVLQRGLERLGEGATARWFAVHAPMLQSNLHGLANAAWVLFGRSPAALNLGQQALLAAAVKWRVPIGSRLDPWAERRSARARFALEALHTSGRLSDADRERGDQEIGDAAARVTRWQRQYDPCRATSIAATLAKGAARPDVFAAEHLLAQLNQAVGELRSARRGARWWEQIAAIRLTTRVIPSCAVRARVEAAWASLRARHPPLARAWFTVALADERGRLLYLASSGGTPWYLGPSLPGGRPAGMAPREIGSVGKILAAVLFARAGDHPDTLYTQAPRRRSSGRPYVNYGGSTGNPARRITARRAFARSDNLAVMWRLDQADISTGDMLELLRGFGFRLRGGRQRAARERLLEAVVLGTAEGTPRDTHRLVQTLGLALANQPAPATACTPYLVDAVLPIGETEWQAIPAPWSGCARALGSLLPAPTQRAFVREVLGAVVEPGGSASAALGRFRPSVEPRIDEHLAKTGTVGKAGGGTRYANVAGHLSVDGHPYSYVVQVGPPPGGDLGRRMTGGAAAVLIAPLIQAVLDELGETG